jgi:hypothetical protein
MSPLPALLITAILQFDNRYVGTEPDACRPRADLMMRLAVELLLINT